MTSVHTSGHLNNLMIKSHSAKITFFGEHSHGTQTFHVIFTHSETSINIILLKFSCISSHFPSKSRNILLNHWPQPMNCCIITYLPLSLYGPDSSGMKVCVTTQGEEHCPPEAKGIQNG